MNRDSDEMKTLNRRLSRRDMLRSATQATIGLAGLSLLGCQSEPARPTTATTPVAATTPSAATTPAATLPASPKRGGRLHIYSSDQAPNLDPMLSISIQTHMRLSLYYSKLVKLVAGSDIYKTEIVPDLAEKWDTSSDGLTWTFYLRKGVKWANKPPMNGRELTADDVVYTIERAGSPEAPNKARYVMIDNVEAVDKYTVKFKLKFNHAQFLFNLGAEPSEIVPKEAVAQEKDLKNWMSGSGPFIMTKYEPSTVAVYDRNPDYFDASKVYLDGIDQAVIKDKAAAIAAFRAGQLDVLGGPIMHVPTKSDVEAVKKTNPNVKVIEYAPNALAALEIKFGGKPFDDPRLRRAVNHALDRDALIAALGEGAGVYTGTFPYHTFPEYALPMDELKKLLKYDPALSKKLLSEAGYPNGLTAKILWDTPSRQVVDIYVQMLKEVGITLDTASEQVDYPAWVSRAYNAQFTHLGRFGYTVGGIWDYVYGLHHSGGNRNGPQTKVAEMDAKIEEAMKSPDKAKQIKLVQEVERWALTDGLYILPTFSGTRWTLVQPWVENYRPGYGAMGGVYAMDYMAYAWLNK